MLEQATSPLFRIRPGRGSVHQPRAASRDDSGRRYDDDVAVDCGPRNRGPRAGEIARRWSGFLSSTRSPEVPASPLAPATLAPTSAELSNLRSERHLGRMGALRGFSSVVPRAACLNLENDRQAGAEAAGSAKAGLHLFTEHDRTAGGTHRRYQPVFDRDETCFLVEIWVDPVGRLLEWSRGAEPVQFPRGTSLAGMQSDIVRMYVDAWSWRPIAYDALRHGMTFEPRISIEERARLAEAFDKMRAVMAEAHARTVSGHVQM